MIPVGNPIKLDNEVYSLILRELLKHKDFGNLLLWVEKFKPHLLDYTEMAKLVNGTYDLNNELIQNTAFFTTVMKIAEYTDNKMGLFLMFLKSK